MGLCFVLCVEYVCVCVLCILCFVLYVFVLCCAVRCVCHVCVAGIASRLTHGPFSVHDNLDAYSLGKPPSAVGLSHADWKDVPASVSGPAKSAFMCKKLVEVIGDVPPDASHIAAKLIDYSQVRRVLGCLGVALSECECECCCVFCCIFFSGLSVVRLIRFCVSHAARSPRP